MKRPSFNNIIFFACFVVLLTGLIFTYSNHFNNSFHFDDDHAIVGNVWVRDIGNVPKFFVDGTTSSSLPQNQTYRPGVTTLCAFDYWVASNNPLNITRDAATTDDGYIPFYYHFNIFICFLFQGLLMFLLFKKILEKCNHHKWNKYFALFITALYCYHAAIAETVNYISARSDGFSTLMMLASIVVYAYYPKLRKFGVFLIPYIIGIFVKEPALMTAPLLFLYILLCEKQADLSRIFSRENFRKAIQSLVSVLVMLGVGGLIYVIYIALKPETNLTAVISPYTYLITQPFVFVQYFKTFILPTELSADTDWASLSTIYDIKFFAGIIFLTGIVWFAIRISRNKKLIPVSFGIFWFLVSLLPTSSIFPLSEMLNDHRVYLPYIGLALAFGYGLFYVVILKNENRFLQTKWMQVALGFFLVMLISGHAFGTYERNKVWENEETLWKDVTEKSPLNGRGWMNYGLTQMWKGNTQEAKKHFERALIFTPNYSLLHINLGVLYGTMGDNTSAEKYYKSAISCGQYLDQCYYYYANFLYRQKRYEEAKTNYKYCIANNPKYFDAIYSLMEVYSITEDWGPLKKLAEETLAIFPGDARCLTYIDAAENKKTKLDIAKELAETSPSSDNFINLSLLYYEDGQYEKCIEACEEAIKLKPDNVIAYNNICSAYNSLKKYDKAVEACSKALEISPDFELAKANLNLAKSQLIQ